MIDLFLDSIRYYKSFLEFMYYYMMDKNLILKISLFLMDLIYFISRGYLIIFIITRFLISHLI